MADNFLAKWLRGSASRVDSEITENRAELQRLVAERPSLRASALWLSELLPELQNPPRLSVPALANHQAQEKLAAGVPLLRGEALSIEPKWFSRRWRRACEALQRVSVESQSPLLAAMARSREFAAGELIAAVLSGQAETIREHVARWKVDPGLTATVLRFVLFPALVSVRSAWTIHLNACDWERGYCPVCGNPPLLGEFRGLEQLRYLRCGWCSGAWKVPRLYCPSCENRDHEKLGSLHRAGEGDHIRATTCDLCGRYVKMLTTLGELHPVRLWVADVATLYLDIAATERG